MTKKVVMMLAMLMGAGQSCAMSVASALKVTTGATGITAGLAMWRYKQKAEQTKHDYDYMHTKPKVRNYVAATLLTGAAIGIYCYRKTPSSLLSQVQSKLLERDALLMQKIKLSSQDPEAFLSAIRTYYVRHSLPLVAAFKDCDKICEAHVTSKMKLETALTVDDCNQEVKDACKKYLEEVTDEDFGNKMVEAIKIIKGDEKYLKQMKVQAAQDHVEATKDLETAVWMNAFMHMHRR